MASSVEDMDTSMSLSQDEVPPAPNFPPDSILRFPDEMLIYIFGFLDLPTEEQRAQGLSRGHTRPELCAVARTCKKLSEVGREAMLRTVELATGYISSINPPYSTDRMRQFVRSCMLNEHLAGHVKRLQIQADFTPPSGWGSTPDDWVPDKVLRALYCRAPLEHLSILLSSAKHIQWLPTLSPTVHAGASFHKLESLYLDCGNSRITPQHFSDICGLPALKYIETTSPVAGERPPTTVPFVSNVETIISSDLSTSSTQLQRLLPWMQKVRVFKASIAGIGLFFDDHDRNHHRSWRLQASGSFSPLRQQRLLLPIINTLQSLTITNPRVLVCGHDGDMAHDGTFLDLSQFRRLEHLQISIHHLCDTSVMDRSYKPKADPKICSPTNGLPSLLPRHLQTLEIHYDSDQGIFYDPHHLFTAFTIEADPTMLNFPRNLHRSQFLTTMYDELWTNRIGKLEGKDGVRDRLGWLLRLVDLKKTKFKELKEVMVRETYAREWTWKDFDLGGMYPEVFGGKDVKIGVVIRIPTEFTPPVRSE